MTFWVHIHNTVLAQNAAVVDRQLRCASMFYYIINLCNKLALNLISIKVHTYSVYAYVIIFLNVYS